MTDPAIVVEEHPEFDNPAGLAAGRLEAAETILAELRDERERLDQAYADAVDRHAAELEKIEIAQSTWDDEIARYTTEVDDATAALAELEGEES